MSVTPTELSLNSPARWTDLFATWFAAAETAEPSDANAMALASVGADGRPSVRIVLMKAWDDAGFTFYTNTLSHKGRELAGQPVAALAFHWKSLRRQVRIEGDVAMVSDAEADAYFASRPRDSQLGAWTSMQSRPLDSRETFQAEFTEVAARFPADVPRPPHWSGYRVTPQRIEFWQDQRHRLHDRLLFTRQADGGWSRCLLYP